MHFAQFWFESVGAKLLQNDDRNMTARIYSSKRLY